MKRASHPKGEALKDCSVEHSTEGVLQFAEANCNQRTVVESREILNGNDGLGTPLNHQNLLPQPTTIFYYPLYFLSTNLWIEI